MSHHDPLSDLLKSWRHTPPDAPRFNAGVWARLGTSRKESNIVSFYRWALPLAASVALILGVGSAVLEAQHKHAEQMASAYVRTVDPLQMSMPASRP